MLTNEVMYTGFLAFNKYFAKKKKEFLVVFTFTFFSFLIFLLLNNVYKPFILPLVRKRIFRGLLASGRGVGFSHRL
jgi:hypothetical protein